MTPARSLATALAVAVAATAAPVAAFDIDALSEAERTALRAEIRTYLLENPEVLMEALQELENRQAAAQAAADNDLVTAHADALFADGYSWVGGNPEGDITLVEFVDYRCGYCRRAHEEVKELVESDGNIRFIVKEFPILGEESLASSRFAIATRQVGGDDAYHDVHEALITLRGNVTEEALVRIGTEAGVDVDDVLVQMESEEVRAELLANRALAEALAINGTPTFILGDEILRGYLPLDAMRQVVAQERGEG